MAKAYLYSLTDTWDNAATTFNAIRMSVTDAASAAGSLLMDLQVGGSSRFSVRKDGQGIFNGLTSSVVTKFRSTVSGSGGTRLDIMCDAIPTTGVPGVGNIGQQDFRCLDANSAETLVGRFGAFCTSAVAGAVSGGFFIGTRQAGTFDTRLLVALGLYMNGATGGDQGANTINASSYYANGNIIADTNALLRCRVFTVGTLPTGIAGARAFVSDANATTFASIVAGGGANGVPVYSDGTNWRIG